MFVVDGSNHQIIATLEVADPCGVAVNPETNIVYVTSETKDVVHVIDGADNTEIAQIPVEKSPRGVAVDTKTNMVYVTNQLSDSLSVIDGATNEVVDSIPVEQPYELMINPKTNKIYSTYSGYQTLSIVNVVDPDLPFDYLTLFGVFSAGTLAAVIAFLVVKNKKSHLKY